MILGRTQVLEKCIRRSYGGRPKVDTLPGAVISLSRARTSRFVVQRGTYGANDPRIRLIHSRDIAILPSLR